MTARLAKEVGGLLGEEPAGLSLLLERRSPQPHAQIIVRILKDGRLLGVAKVPRHGSGAFFLRREALAVKWLNECHPEVGALAPLGTLESPLRPGLLYPPAGDQGTGEGVAQWLRTLQESTGRRATAREASRAVVTRRAVRRFLADDARPGYDRAREVILARARAGRQRVVVRHGDVTRENVRRSGRAIDWVHFRRSSLPEYDWLYFLLVEEGLFRPGAGGEAGTPESGGLLDRIRNLARLETAGGEGKEELCEAGLVLSAAELAYQSALRTRIALRYGQKGEGGVDRRLKLLALALARSYSA